MNAPWLALALIVTPNHALSLSSAASSGQCLCTTGICSSCTVKSSCSTLPERDLCLLPTNSTLAASASTPCKSNCPLLLSTGLLWSSQTCLDLECMLAVTCQDSPDIQFYRPCRAEPTSQGCPYCYAYSSINPNYAAANGTGTKATDWILYSIGPIVAVVLVCVWICFRRRNSRKKLVTPDTVQDAPSLFSSSDPLIPRLKDGNPAKATADLRDGSGFLKNQGSENTIRVPSESSILGLDETSWLASAPKMVDRKLSQMNKLAVSPEPLADTVPQHRKADAAAFRDRYKEVPRPLMTKSSKDIKFSSRPCGTAFSSKDDSLDTVVFDNDERHLQEFEVPEAGTAKNPALLNIPMNLKRLEPIYTKQTQRH
ncbi:hypothetical protein HDU91_001399 [Kappamyces sp. JEL0680]|nr:hypothetical protein HDU91_001399 [Kappamyces sp. JEL0680]